MKWFMSSKLHKARVTQADVSYVGSVTIDSSLMKLSGLEPGEKVLVTSNTSGVRLETYAIEGPPGSGTICMNGAAAHLIGPGEEIIIIGFTLASKPVEPKVVLVDKDNHFVRFLTETFQVD